MPDTPTIVHDYRNGQSRVFATREAAVTFAQKATAGGCSCVLLGNDTTEYHDKNGGSVRVTPFAVSTFFPRFRRDGGHIVGS